MAGLHPRSAELLDAIEWELQFAVDFDRYPLVANTPRGEVRAYQLTTVPPGIIVVRKVLLLDCRVPYRLPEDDQ
jgi:hypothetical protein